MYHIARLGGIHNESMDNVIICGQRDWYANLRWAAEWGI